MVEQLAAVAPVLIAIDDLQWLDGASVQVLEFAVRRLSGRVGVLAAQRLSDGARMRPVRGAHARAGPCPQRAGRAAAGRPAWQGRARASRAGAGRARAAASGVRADRSSGSASSPPGTRSSRSRSLLRSRTRSRSRTPSFPRACSRGGARMRKPIVRWLEDRGQALDRAWALAIGRRGRGLILAAGGDLGSGEDVLLHALEAHERLPLMRFGWDDQPRGRRGTVHQLQDRRGQSRADLPQARDSLARGARAADGGSRGAHRLVRLGGQKSN